MANEQPYQSQSLVAMNLRQFLWVVAIGLGIGIVAWLADRLLTLWVFQPLLCSHSVATACTISRNYSEVAALVIATGVGTFLLVRTQIFRPLLVSLAAALTLWGLLETVHVLTWPWALLVMAVMFGLAYALYAWISRVRSFLLAVIVTVVVLIVVRYILTS